MVKSKVTKSSSEDEIANVNCFTTTSDTLQSTINLPKNYGTDIGHTVFTIDRKPKKTITTIKGNLNDKLQVSNGKIHSTHECLNLVTHTNFTALCVTEANF